MSGFYAKTWPKLKISHYYNGLTSQLVNCLYRVVARQKNLFSWNYPFDHNCKFCSINIWSVQTLSQLQTLLFFPVPLIKEQSYFRGLRYFGKPVPKYQGQVADIWVELKDNCSLSGGVLFDTEETCWMQILTFPHVAAVT